MPPNRLAREKSPYLQQHAENPVDWYAWGAEAFERAKHEDKPVFLSIGYSTCHWCHVMEEESFEDAEVARLMNQAFVNIKVDREERPDIDGVYMRVCQAMTGSGGWPLTIVMTPDRKPFFAATYIPKRERFGRVGMMELVPRIQEAWSKQRDDLVRSAESILQHVSAPAAPTPAGKIRPATLDAAFDQLALSFDEGHGGFGKSPKFPTPHQLSFLLRYGRRSKDAWANRMVEQTLTAMRGGGIWDHVGFGFHRYSTDPAWFLPHFEKMLYDQALLTIAYVEAYQATGREEYEQTAREIIEYVRRDLGAPEGGFHSAEDADSEGVEGKFYAWTDDELHQVLGPDDAAFVSKSFGVSSEGNFREEATGHRSGANILHRVTPDDEAFQERWEPIRQRLLEYRGRRVRPFKDDKILTDWNGLMIAALARASQALDAPEYAQAAKKAADFLLGRMRDEKGGLLHRFRGGEAAISGYLDDYAFLAFGLTDLYEAAFEPRYLETAIQLTEHALQHFSDEARGGFHFTADESESLIVREKEYYDGAVPSGNSVMMLNLLRLGRITGRTEWEERAQRVAQSNAGMLERAPAGHTQMLIALDFALGPTREIVVAGRPESAETKSLLSAIRHVFLPNKVVLLRTAAGDDPIPRMAPFTQQLVPQNGKATAFVCKGYSCDLPVVDPQRLSDQLKA